MNGISFDLQQNGDTLLVVDRMVDNVAVGWVRSYYPNGKVNEMLQVDSLPKDYFIGELGGRFGNPKWSRRSGLTGSIDWYYDNGQLESHVGYYKGLLDGNALSYHPNGQLKAKAIYSKGMPTDTVSVYNEEGKLQEEFIFDSEGKVISDKRF